MAKQMNREFLSHGLLFGVMLLLFGLVSGSEALGRTKPTTYSVVQVTAMDKSISFKVVDDEMVAFMKKELDKEYKEALKSWTDAQKAAKKAKEEFTEPKPSKPLVKVMAKGLKQEEAKTAKKKAEEGESAKDNGSGKITDSKTRYSVYKITGYRGDVSFELVPDKDGAGKKKEVEQAYKEALKAWESEKNEAKKSKTKFDKEKPMKPVIKVLKKGLKKDKAEELLKKEEEALLKKESKESGGDQRLRSLG